MTRLGCWLTVASLVAIFGLAQAGNNCSAADATRNCIDGLVVPIWRPFLDLSSSDRLFRGILYFIVIAYMFLGISIVADRFMSSIEVITSMERTIVVKRPGLDPMSVQVRIWNDTVSNLTLMALGSSAPEILLSIIEVIARHFEAGDLGPNTIVGSAAFNLFMIIAICVVVIPTGEVRRQKHLDVFCVTATWSVFAYVWLYLILAFFSPGVIEIWEGFVTFLFFPLTVLTAYIADIKVIQNKFLPHKYRRGSHGQMIATEAEEMKMLENGLPQAITDFSGEGGVDPAIKAFEEHRQEFIELMREIRKQNPHITPTELQKQAEYEMISRGPKSRAFYRVQATRRLIGGGDIVKKRIDKEHNKALDAAQEKQHRDNTCKIYFDPAHYTVLENVGSFNVVVGRDGGPEGLTVMVDYYTEDGTANAGSDFIPVKGTLTFYPEDKHQKINIEVVDDDVFEEDEHFYLHLRNLRVRTKDGLILDPSRIGGLPVAQLEMPATATIMILDDDHAGVFGFEHDHFEIVENCGHLSLKMQRHSGARGKVVIPFRTIEGSAQPDKHFESKEGEVVFEDNQTEAFIDIGIIDTEQYERADSFYIEISPPIWAKKMNDLTKVQERFQRRMERKRGSSVASESKDSTTEQGDDEIAAGLTASQLEVAEMGKPRLGDITKCQITIRESKEFQGIVDRMIKNANTRIMLGTSSWREQFAEALIVNAGDDDDDDEEGEDDGEDEKEAQDPSCMDYFMHILTVPWKLTFATIPPTDYMGGWATFVVAIFMIGVLTAVVGDLASQFGCWVGLKDSVTAISFVALGTSVPDTFASKVSAVQDKYADNAVGNVTGSNAVNVFLGIGIAWSMAAIYHWSQGTVFEVDPGNLGFSVLIFCCEAFMCIAVIVARRHPRIGGELGGPVGPKWATALFFTSLWVIYLTLSGLEAYCYIPGF